MLSPRDLGDAFTRRASGQSWRDIGAAHGITREAARQRYAASIRDAVKRRAEGQTWAMIARLYGVELSGHRRALRLLGEAEAAQRAMVAQESPGEAPDTNGGM